MKAKNKNKNFLTKILTFRNNSNKLNKINESLWACLLILFLLLQEKEDEEINCHIVFIAGFSFYC